MTDRESYVKKLTLSNGSRLPDPYAITEWKYDSSKRPNLQWPEIHLYLVETQRLHQGESARL